MKVILDKGSCGWAIINIEFQVFKLVLKGSSLMTQFSKPVLFSFSQRKRITNIIRLKSWQDYCMSFFLQHFQDEYKSSRILFTTSSSFTITPFSFPVICLFLLFSFFLCASRRNSSHQLIIMGCTTFKKNISNTNYSCKFPVQIKCLFSRHDTKFLYN